MEKERDEYKRKWGNLKMVVASRHESIKKLKEENEKLKEELKAYEKSIRNSGEIEMRQEEEIKNLKLELKAAQEVSVVYMKRYEQKAGEERKIDEICSRIKCDDTFRHLIGKVPK